MEPADFNFYFSYMPSYASGYFKLKLSFKDETLLSNTAIILFAIDYPKFCQSSLFIWIALSWLEYNPNEF